jgi:diaminopimelate epimerase
VATHFVKSHGLGNDYLVADPAELPVELSPARVRLICDRHHGVGSDGILVLAEARGDAEYGLRILNPDGSEAEKSGNGIRIFAKWLYDTGRARRKAFPVEMLGGTVHVELEVADERATSVTANMGRPTFREDLRTIEHGSQVLPVVALTIGNPHCVVVRDHLDVADLRWFGPLIERHPAFPNRTNVQLARPVARDRVEALIWERGAGETLASGSSACAVAAACHRLGLVDEQVTVAMPGGELSVRVDPGGDLWMRGPVEEIALITLSPDVIARLRALA